MVILLHAFLPMLHATLPSDRIGVARKTFLYAKFLDLSDKICIYAHSLPMDDRTKEQ